MNGDSLLVVSLRSELREQLSWLEFSGAWIVGSRATCDPPPTDTDIDVLVLVKDLKETSEICQSKGFELSGSCPVSNLSVEGTQFVSLKQPSTQINVIATNSTEFYHKFLAASSIAKRLNVLDKDDRIALFQAVLYGNQDTKNMPPSV